MRAESEQRFIQPIIEASYPATLSGLDLTVLTISGFGGRPIPLPLSLALLFGAATFLLSAFAIFAHSLYPTRRSIWMLTAVTYLLGLVASIVAVVVLLVVTVLT